MLKNTDADKYYEEGLQLVTQKKFSQAILRYKKAISLKPDFPNSYLEWGFSLFNLNDYHGAIDKYRKVIKQDPKIGAAYYNIGVLSSYHSRYEEAVVYYEKGIHFGYDKPSSYNNWGYVLGCLGKYDEAVDKLRKAIGSNFRYDLPYINCGVILYHQGKKFKAKQAYIVGIIKAISNPARIQSLINIYQKQVEVANEQLTTSDVDEILRSRWMTRLKALEEVLDLLQLPYKELSKMLVPSSHKEKLYMGPSNNETTVNTHTSLDLKLHKYHDSLYGELLEILRSSFETGVLDIVEKEDITYLSISQALRYLPADFASLCSLEGRVDIPQENADNTTSDFKARLTRKPLYRSFIDHFISINEVKYVLAELATKLSTFRREKTTSEFTVKEDSSTATVFIEEKSISQSLDEICREKLAGYLQLDVSIVTIIFLLEGVEVVEYNCIDEKTGSLADGVFKKAKDYIERLDR